MKKWYMHTKDGYWFEIFLANTHSEAVRLGKKWCENNGAQYWKTTKKL